METEIQKKIEKNGMIISRIPSWAKETIKEIAIEEHANDYGACIAQFVREANEYRILKSKFFENDLNVTISHSQIEQVPSDDKKIQFANGKQLNTPEEKHE